MTADRVGEIVMVLRADGSVRIPGGRELATRTYGGYEGRNPLTGAVVAVPSKTLPLLREATDDAVDLDLEASEVLSGAPVWMLPGIGFLAGLGVGDRGTGSDLLPFASFRMALNGAGPPRSFADHGSVQAAIAPSAAIARLVSYRATGPVSIDLARLERALGGSAPALVLEAEQALAGCEIPPFTFEDPLPREGFQGVACASLSDFSWRLILEGTRAVVIETSSEPTERLDVDVFLGQAALVAAIVDAAGDELLLPEDGACEVMRAMLKLHPSITRLTTLLPF